MRRFAFTILKFVAPAVALVLGTQAQADPITDLFNTGTITSTTNGSVLAPKGSIDSHYVLSGPVGPPAFVEQAFPPVYVPNTPTSQFIGPYANGNTSAPAGIYSYTTTFTIGAPFTAASLSGLVAADNSVQINLNGKTIANVPPDAYKAFTAFSDSVAADFKVGVNTLTFFVTNVDYQTALQVNALAGSFTTSAVPAPASILMLGIAGVASLGLAGFRRLRAA